jgi:hypothetical protein
MSYHVKFEAGFDHSLTINACLRYLRDRQSIDINNYLCLQRFIIGFGTIEDVNHLPYKQGVTGSNPVSPTTNQAPFEREAFLFWCYCTVCALFFWMANSELKTPVYRTFILIKIWSGHRAMQN